MELSERWRMLFSNADPKSTVGQFPYPEWGDEIAQLEAEIAKLNYIKLPSGQVSNVFEAYITWKNKAAQLEAKNEWLRKGLVKALGGER